jgi:hypothetical protein
MLTTSFSALGRTVAVLDAGVAEASGSTGRNAGCRGVGCPEARIRSRQETGRAVADAFRGGGRERSRSANGPSSSTSGGGAPIGERRDAQP